MAQAEWIMWIAVDRSGLRWSDKRPRVGWERSAGSATVFQCSAVEGVIEERTRGEGLQNTGVRCFCGS